MSFETYPNSPYWPMDNEHLWVWLQLHGTLTQGEKHTFLNYYFCFAVDFVAAPFRRDLLHIYENCDDPDVFFRPGLRIFLVSIFTPGSATGVIVLTSCVCVYVTTLLLEQTDIQTWNLVCRSSVRISRSRSRSPDQKNVLWYFCPM